MFANNKLPEPVILNDEEKFRVNKKVVEIEARGERTLEGIFFRFSDLDKHFKLHDIKTENEQMFNHRLGGRFEKDRHFKYYKNKKNEYEYYLTYNGVIHMMGSCESKHAREFEKWAAKIVYTVQMGSKEEKEELASQLLGTPLKEIKERITDKIDERLTFLYILSLGKVQKFRNEIKEPSEDMKDNHIVFKHGYTGNIAKQASQIQYKYGSESADLRILKVAIIDKSNIRKAKSQFFKKVKEISDGRNKLNYKKHIDFFSTNENNMFQLKQFLDKIGETHGSSPEAKALRKEMKQELDKMQKKMDEKDDEIKEMKKELDEKDDEIKEINEELDDKDAEIEDLTEELDDKKAQLDEVNAELNARNAELDETKEELVEAYDEIKKWKRKLICEELKKKNEMKRMNRKLMFEEMKKKLALRTARLNDQLHTQHANVLMQIIRTQKTLLDMNNN